MDGTLVATIGERKQDMEIWHKGVWGFHPLVMSLAETGVVLRIVNRSGNRTSHEGAAAEVRRGSRALLLGGLPGRAPTGRHRLLTNRAPRSLAR